MTEQSQSTSRECALRALGKQLVQTCDRVHAEVGISPLQVLGEIGREASALAAKSMFSIYGRRTGEPAVDEILAATDLATIEFLDAARSVAAEFNRCALEFLDGAFWRARRELVRR